MERQQSHDAVVQRVQSLHREHGSSVNLFGDFVFLNMQDGVTHGAGEHGAADGAIIGTNISRS